MAIPQALRTAVGESEVRPLAPSQDLLAILERLLGFGVWEWDPPTGRWWVSDGLRVLLGLGAGRVTNLGDILDHIDPGDRVLAERQVRDALGGVDGFGFEAAALGRTDRRLQWIGHVDHSPAVGLRITAVVLDVSAEIEATRRAREDLARAAHDLRNTASTIIQAVPTLRDVVHRAPQHADQIIEIVLGQSQQLREQCHAMLDTSAHGST